MTAGPRRIRHVLSLTALAVLALALASGGCPSRSTPGATPSTEARATPQTAADAGGAPEPCAQDCAADSDCACGRDVSSGRCAVGQVRCIDQSRPCPDFCAGITGRLRTVCVNHRCVQK